MLDKLLTLLFYIELWILQLFPRHNRFSWWYFDNILTPIYELGWKRWNDKTRVR